MYDIDTLTFISALVAAFSAIYSGLKSNSTSKEVERMRHSHDFQTFKFKKLYEEYLVILETIREQFSGPYPHRNLNGNADDEEMIIRVVASQTKVSEEIQSAYARTKPFMKNTDKEKIDKMITREKQLQSELARQLEEAGGAENIFNELIFMRSEISKEIQDSIFNMLDDTYSPN